MSVSIANLKGSSTFDICPDVKLCGPSISGSSNSGLIKSGSFLIGLFGKHFMTNHHSPIIRIDVTSALMSMWISDSSVIAKAASSAFFGSRSVELSIASKTVFIISNNSLDAINISSITSHVAPTTGSILITIFGHGFGNSWSSSSVEVGVLSPQVIWMSDSSITCKLNAFLSSSVKTKLNGFDSLSPALIFDAMSISAMTKYNSPVVQSDARILVFGSNFGIQDPTLTVFIDSQKLVTSWISESCAVASPTFGTGQNLTISLQSKGVAGKPSHLVFSYDSLAVLDDTDDFVPTGGGLINIFGTNFGTGILPVPSASIGLTTCTQVLRPIMDLITCVVQPGTGQGLSICAYRSTEEFCLPLLFSYRAPTVSGSQSAVFALPTTGKTVVTLYGRDFGTHNYCPISRLARKDQFSTHSTRTLWVSTTSMNLHGSRSVGDQITVFASVSLQSSNRIQSVVSIPSLFQLSIGFPVTSSFYLSLLANNFGLSGHSIRSNFLKTSSESSIWTSDTLLIMKSSRRGPLSNRTSIVSVQRVIGSTTAIIAESFPYLRSTIYFDSGKTSSGSMIITVSGERLYSTDTSPSARFIQSATENAFWLSDSVVVSKASSWIHSALTHKLLVSSNRETSSIFVQTFISEYSDAVLSYLIEVSGLSNINHTNLIQSTGSTPLIILGSAFGVTDASLIIKFLSTTFSSTSWISHSSIYCKGFTISSRKNEYSNAAVLSVNSHLIHPFALSEFSFRAPNVSSPTFLFPSTGSLLAFRFYAAIGCFDQTVKIRSQLSTPESSHWVSDSSMTSKFSSGTSFSTNLHLSIDSTIFSFSSNTSYSTSDLTSSFTKNFSSSGNLQITCHGSSFGLDHSSLRARYFHTSDKSTLWTSDSSMNFKIGSFSQKIHPSATVSLLGQKGTFFFNHSKSIYGYSSILLNYTIPSTGSSLVSLIGSGMLQVDMSNAASFGSSACSVSMWKSTSSMLCKIPKYSTIILKLLLSVNQERLSSTDDSYIICDISWANSSNELPTTGSVVQLTPTNFGIFDTSAKLSLSTSCESTYWRADSSICCKSPQSESKHVNLIATLATQKFVSDLLLTHSAPIISAVHPSTTPSTGSGILTLSGNGFIFHNMSLLPMKIGSTPFEHAIYVSDSSLLATSPAGEGLVNVYFEKNRASTRTIAYTFGSIDIINVHLSDLRTGHTVQLEMNFSSSQAIEKLGMIYFYLPSQIKLQSRSTFFWSSSILEDSGIWSIQKNMACFEFKQKIPPATFSVFVKDIVLSSIVGALSSVLVRSSMASNITIDNGSFEFYYSIVPSDATKFSITHLQTFYAGDIINVTVFVKPFNEVEEGDTFSINFPESGASFALASLSSTPDLALLYQSNSLMKMKVLNKNSANHSFMISNIFLQPFSGTMSSFSGNHSNHLGILKENWAGAGSFPIQPGRLQKTSLKFSNTTIGSKASVFISFITVNELALNSIIVFEFDSDDVSFTDDVFWDSRKLLSHFDGKKRIAIQIPQSILSNTFINISFFNVYINLGSSRFTSANVSSLIFHSNWNVSAPHESVIIDSGSSNSIELIAPMFLVRSNFSSLQMRTRVFLNMTMQIPNILPVSGSLEIFIFNDFKFSHANISITSNCFEAVVSTSVLSGTKASSSFRSLQLRAFQKCFIRIGPIETPGYPGYNGKTSLIIRGEDGIFASGESNTEFFFVSFISARITGNCSVSLSWNNTALLELPVSWAISCSACTESFRRKTYAPHLRLYHYDNMPCLSGNEFEFSLREIDVNGTAVIPKSFGNLDPFEPDQWSVKLMLVTLPSAPVINYLNQSLSQRAHFNWIPLIECHDGNLAYCPIASSLISVTSLCHPSPDLHSTEAMFFDIEFEFSTNHTVCISFINAAGTSLPSCFSQQIDQPYQSSASIAFVEPPSNISAGSIFIPAVTVILTSISEPLGNLTIFASFTVNETKSFAASYQSCAVTSQDGIAIFNTMSLAGIGTATMNASLSETKSVESPKFQITIGTAAKISLFNIAKVVVAAVKFPSNLIAEVTDAVDNVHTELAFEAMLALTSLSDPNRSFVPFFATSKFGVVSFENVSIAEVGDYFGQVKILNFQSSMFLITVISGASISIQAEIQPSDSKGGETFSPRQPLLTLRDRGNNIAIDYFDYVTVSFDFASEGKARILGVSGKFSYLGVCRFYDMAIDLAGQYRLKYSSVGLISAYSKTIVVIVGAPYKLAILKQPSNAMAASSTLDFSIVKVVDRGTNLVNSSNATVQADFLDFFANVQLGTLTTECIFGVAAFSNIPIRNNGTSYFLAFYSSGLLPVSSHLFAVVPGPASSVSIASFPLYALGGLAFEPAVRLMCTDSWGNALHSGYANGPDRSAVVSIQNCSHFSCIDNLLGNRSSKFYDGVATFTNCAISLVGWYVLTFSIENVSTFRNLTVYNSNASFLTVERKPAACFGGQMCIVQPMIAVRDVATNVVESHVSVLNIDVHVNISRNMTWKFLGTITSFSHGIAVYKDFGFDKIGTYSVTFEHFGIIPCSISVNVIPGIQSSFRLTQFPAINASGGTAFSVQPILTFYDLGFNVANVSDATVSVLLLFSNGTLILPSSNNLFGELKVVSDGPVATFYNIGIRTAALGYMLLFSSPMVPDIAHHPINVYPGVACSMHIQYHPTNAFGAQVFTPQPEIWLVDLGDNVAAHNHDVVTVSLLFATNARSRILGTINVSASYGVCRYVDLAIDLIGTYILLYSTEGIKSTLSPNISIFVGPSANLRLGSQPSNISGGSQFRPFVFVEIIDLGGNLVVSDNFSTIYSRLLPRDANATLVGNLTSIASAGIATFSNITVDKIGQHFSLHFSADFAVVSSDTFCVTIGDLKVLNVVAAPSSVIAGQCMYPMPMFGLFDAGWNAIYSEDYKAVLRLSPLSRNDFETQNMSRNGMFVFGCINSTKAGESSVTLLISPGGLFFESSNFTTVHGKMHHLTSSRFPIFAFCGVPFSTQPIIQIADEFENYVYFEATPALSVHASLNNIITGQSILLGPTTQDVRLDGSAHFYSLYIDLHTSTDWRILFRSNDSGILALTSPGIRMHYGDAVKLKIPTQVLSAQSGRRILPYCVSVLDTGGNIKKDYNGSIFANISKAFTHKWIPMVVNNFSSEDRTVNTSSGQACFSIVFPFSAIFSLVFSLQNEPSIFIETPLFMVSECEVKNISFASSSIQNFDGGNTLTPFPRIEINGEGCASSGDSIFNVVAHLVYANGSIPMNSTFKSDVTANPVNGLVEFKNIIIDRSDGPYAIKFFFGTFTVQSNYFFVLIGPPQIMHIIQQPSQVNVAGEKIITQPLLGFFDIGMNLNKTMIFHVNATLYDSNSEVSLLSGNSIVASSEGLAEFNNLIVNLAAINWTLVFSCLGFVSVTSNSFQTKVGRPYELILTADSEPVNATACLFFPVQPVVIVVDKGGNTVPAGSGEYSQEYLLTNIFIQGNDTSLYGWAAFPSQSGVFRFANLTYCQRGFNFVIAFSLNNSTVPRKFSRAFSIPIGIAMNLRVSQEPSDAIAGEIMRPAVGVGAEFYDGSFAPDANIMHVNLVSKSSNTSFLVDLLPMAKGFAVISSFAWNHTGVFHFEFNLHGLKTISKVFEIKHGSPQKISIRTQPPDAFATQSLCPPPDLLVLDRYDNFATVNGTMITASLFITGNSTVLHPTPILTGIKTCIAHLGLCSFFNLSINKVYSAYQIVFSSVNFTYAVHSMSFKIHHGAPVRMFVLSEPPSTFTAGNVLSQPIQVALLDLGDNIAETGSHQITAYSNISSAWTMSNATILGIASFFGITISLAGSYNINFGGSGFANISTRSIDVVPGAVVQIEFQPVANSSSVQSLFSKEHYPIVTLRDKGHNLVNVSQLITLFMNTSNASLRGSLSVWSISGVAAFQNVYIEKAGSNYQLIATCNNSGSVLFAQSSPFDVIPGPPTAMTIYGSLGFEGFGMKSAFFFTNKLIPSVCLLVTDNVGNGLNNFTVEISSKGASNPLLSGVLAVRTDVDGIACFDSLILKGVHNASVTFMFLTKFNNSNISMRASSISVLPQLDIEALLDGTFISFSSTLNVPSSYQQATSAAFGANLRFIFEDATIKSFGVGASCRWISDNRFVVTLGASPSFGMQDHIRFVPFFLQNLFFFDHSKLRYIQVPLILPNIDIVFGGSTTVFGCASVRIDIFDSTGFYGRPFSTRWKLKSISRLQIPGNYSEVSVFNAVAVQLLNWNDSYLFEISKIVIQNETVELPPATYSFEIETIRWVDGKQQVSAISVTKSNDVIPTVSILGPKLMRVFTHQGLELIATASAACGSPSSFSFYWQITDSLNPTVDILAFAGSSLTVPEYTFSLKSTYDVSLTVTSGSLRNFDKMRILPKRSPPILIIKGGNGTFVLDSDLFLDSTPSIDQDGANFDDFTFEWKCEFRNNSVCITAIDSPESRVAMVSKSSLLSGMAYIFSLTAATRDKSIISTSKVSLLILPAGAPRVTLNSVVRKVDPEKTLRLEGAVQPLQDLIWTELTKHDVLLPSNIFPSSDSRAVVFRPSVLPPGATLKLRLSTVSSSSFAEVEFSVNQAPFGGKMLVSSSPFVVDVYLAEITMSGWSDDFSDLPIFFEFSVSNAGSVDLASASSTSSTRKLFLPNIEKLTIVASISDSLGTSRQIYHNTDLNNVAKTDGKSQNIVRMAEIDRVEDISSKLLAVQATGDVGALISLCNAILGTMFKFSSNQTEIEALRDHIISLISGSIPSFPPLRSSQAAVTATALANCIVNISSPYSLIAVKNSAIKLLHSSMINVKPSIIEKIMIIAASSPASFRPGSKRMLMQQDIALDPDIPRFFEFLNFLERILSPSLVLGQDVVKYVVPGLTFVAAITESEFLCQKVDISEVQTATIISVSDSQCLTKNLAFSSSPVVLLSWNTLANPFSSVSNVVLKSGVMRFNARANNGVQLNASSLHFTFKIYKQPAEWTSMSSLAICVKWEFNVTESDGHWSAQNCRKMYEDFDHLICSCAGLSVAAITIIQKDCADEPFGIPGFKAIPSTCIPEQITPIAIIAGILSVALVLSFLAVALYRRFRSRQESMRQHMQITVANIEETQNSLWTAEIKAEGLNSHKADAWPIAQQ
jgi:hypothetical protein